MTIEQEQPQAAPPPSQQEPTQQGPSQGHRRRRRRRKGQSGSNAAKGQATPNGNGQPGVQVNAQAAPPHKQKSSNQGRFGPKNNAGNGQNGGGSRRKSKPRRQQVFVGPMDHSYRIANGNLADGPAGQRSSSVMSTATATATDITPNRSLPNRCRRRFAKMRPPESSSLSRICSSWQRSRRRPRN